MIPSSVPDQPEPYATLILQDVYEGLDPCVRRGEVKAIRAVRELLKTVRIDPHLRASVFQFPAISCGATYAARLVLSKVPVEPDGSASFRVPAGVLIYFLALDSQGRAVQRMRSFAYLMPGEVRARVGDHEHRGITPGLNDTLALSRPPRELRRRSKKPKQAL